MDAVTRFAASANVPTVPPAGIMTCAGTGNTLPLLVVSVINDPPAGAGPLNVTVRVTEAGPASVAGLSEIDLMVGSVTGVMVTDAVAVELLYEAVTVAVADAVGVPAFTCTIALLCPAGTTTLAGAGNAAVFVLESATVDPPLGAGPDSVTVIAAVLPAGTVPDSPPPT